MVTHNLNVVRHVADRVAIMYLGRFVETGPTEDVFRQPRHPYTAALLSANPESDPDARMARIELQGDVPSLLKRPSGCEFHTRCFRVQATCRDVVPARGAAGRQDFTCRSEEHTSELTSLMRISYAVFCLKKKKKTHK